VTLLKGVFFFGLASFFEVQPAHSEGRKRKKEQVLYIKKNQHFIHNNIDLGSRTQLAPGRAAARRSARIDMGGPIYKQDWWYNSKKSWSVFFYNFFKLMYQKSDYGRSVGRIGIGSGLGLWGGDFKLI
jgi:hypothetical protein